MENTDNLYNYAFERSVLSSIMFEPSQIHIVSQSLNESDFYLPAHRDIYNIMQQLDKKDLPIDEEFLKKYLVQHNKFDEQVMLEMLTATPISDITAYISEIKDGSVKRSLLTLSTDIKKLMFEGSIPTADIISMISKQVDEQHQNITSLLPNNFNQLLEQLSDTSLLAVPKDLQPIEGTHGFFYLGGMHVVHGLSKAGKTYFVLQTLNQAKGVKVVWLDGDQNDLTMVNKFTNITHLAPLSPDIFLDRWINTNIDYSGVVFVIDSLKDFKNSQEMDTNNGMDNIIKRLKQLTKMGATVVVVHHSTLKRGVGKDGKDTIKIKGNEEAIYSNSDITYLFERNFEEGTSALKAERSRVDTMRSGTIVTRTKEMGWVKVTELSLTSISENSNEEIF